MKADECTLFSGGAKGAEAEFGAAAEKAGMDEVNFTFEGHQDARQRGLRIFLLGTVDDLLHRPVMAQVDHLGAGGLDDAAHDIDGSIMAVEKGSGSDDADVVFGLVYFSLLHGCCCLSKRIGMQI